MVWPVGAKQKPRGWVFPVDGRKLRVGIPLNFSFLDLVYWDNQTHEISGYCVEVFLAAIKLLPYESSADRLVQNAGRYLFDKFSLI